MAAAIDDGPSEIVTLVVVGVMVVRGSRAGKSLHHVTECVPEL